MPARILIIDPSGRVRRSDSIGYVSSYLSMATETVDYLFPPLMRRLVGYTNVGMQYIIKYSTSRKLGCRPLYEKEGIVPSNGIISNISL